MLLKFVVSFWSNDSVERKSPHTLALQCWGSISKYVLEARCSQSPVTGRGFIVFLLRSLRPSQQHWVKTVQLLDSDKGVCCRHFYSYSMWSGWTSQPCRGGRQHWKLQDPVFVDDLCC